MTRDEIAELLANRSLAQMGVMPQFQPDPEPELPLLRAMKQRVDERRDINDRMFIESDPFNPTVDPPTPILHWRNTRESNRR